MVDQWLAKKFLKGPHSKYTRLIAYMVSVTATQLFSEAAMDNTLMNRHDCVPLNFIYKNKQVVHSLQTPVLGHNINLNKLKNIETQQSMCSDHDRIKLEVIKRMHK